MSVTSCKRSGAEGSERAADRESLGPSARKQGLAVRAFFAIALGEELRASAAACARELAARAGGDGVRWVAPAALHLTLRFLGNVPSAELDALSARAQDALAGCTPFTLALGAPLAIPTRLRPKVIALAALPEGALAGVAARLEKVAIESGLAPEERTFRAHVTLGRVRARRFPEIARDAPAGTQLVREVVLFRSDLGHDGAQYSRLATLALDAGVAELAHRSPH